MTWLRDAMDRVLNRKREIVEAQREVQSATMELRHEQRRSQRITGIANHQAQESRDWLRDLAETEHIASGKR